MFNKFSHKLHYTLIPALFMFVTNPAFAGGLQKTKQYLSQFSTEIHGFAGIVFVLAGLFAGYQMMWRGQPFESIAKVIYGAITLIVVPEIALWLFP